MTDFSKIVFPAEPPPDWPIFDRMAYAVYMCGPHADPRTVARAVLKAMREPSEGQLQAVWDDKDCFKFATMGDEDFAAYWRTMVGALLSESPEQR